jgi:hypothetical protein
MTDPPRDSAAVRRQPAPTVANAFFCEVRDARDIPVRSASSWSTRTRRRLLFWPAGEVDEPAVAAEPARSMSGNRRTDLRDEVDR